MQCWDLGKFILLTRHVLSLSPAKVEQQIAIYKEHFHPNPSPSVNCAAVDFVENYCCSHDISEEELVHQYDWEYWLQLDDEGLSEGAIEDGGGKESASS